MEFIIKVSAIAFALTLITEATRLNTNARFVERNSRFKELVWTALGVAFIAAATIAVVRSGSKWEPVAPSLNNVVSVAPDNRSATVTLEDGDQGYTKLVSFVTEDGHEIKPPAEQVKSSDIARADIQVQNYGSYLDFWGLPNKAYKLTIVIADESSKNQ